MRDNKISIFSFIFRSPLKTLSLMAAASLFLSACGPVEENAVTDPAADTEITAEEKEQDLNS